jgi:hypothetical protein
MYNFPDNIFLSQLWLELRSYEDVLQNRLYDHEVTI